MLTPAASANAILRWFDQRSLAAIGPALAALDDRHAVLIAADAIADAADSEDETLRNAGLSALFAGLIEPLNDGFTPAGRAVYARIFGRMVWRIAARQPALAQALAGFGVTSEATLLARHARVRQATAIPATEPRTVAVLSRVTIGADILLTSLALQAAHARWPAARVVLIGDGKLAGLFAGLPQMSVRPLTYARRGPLRDRLAAWLTLVEALRAEQADVVIAPDSRLDQLGLLPVCPEAHYLLWENCQPEGVAVRSLADLFAAWLDQRLGAGRCAGLTPALALDAPTQARQRRLAAAFGAAPLCAVKLDHGGNPAKALPRAAEVLMLRRLRELGWRILLDRGFGADELANSDALLSALGMTAVDLDDSGKGLGLAVDELLPGCLAPANILRFHGSIAGWAAACACCQLAFSYDSVGHHLAAALGVPVVVAFTGFADPDFPVAWQPRGIAPVTLHAIPTTDKDDPACWQALISRLPQPVASA